MGVVHEKEEAAAAAAAVAAVAAAVAAAEKEASGCMWSSWSESLFRTRRKINNCPPHTVHFVRKINSIPPHTVQCHRPGRRRRR